jgi:hypothetical protein
MYNADYVLLTPKDMLTKDEAWINRGDLIDQFGEIPLAIPNDQLRSQISNYFRKQLRKKPTRDDLRKAVELTIDRFPEVIDYFIKTKEDNGERAVRQSSTRVRKSETRYVKQVRLLMQLLHDKSAFYGTDQRTEDETRSRIDYFKDIIENKGGFRLLYVDGEPVRKEADIHILFRLVWFGTPSDVSREVNDGRGPADFKISNGSGDKTVVEFKLASNSQLERNLKHQVEIYKKASDAKTGFKVIFYFSAAEKARVMKILRELGMQNDRFITLVDARKDNKPTGSKA